MNAASSGELHPKRLKNSLIPGFIACAMLIIADNESMKLKIKVVPSSSKDCVAGRLGDSLKVKVKAPPEKGKANKAVIKVLEKTLKLSKGSVIIESGQTSQLKIISINNEDESVIQNRLAKLGNKQH